MLSVGFSLSVGPPPPGLTGGMAGCWKVLFEVIVGVEDDIDVMGDEDAVVVVIWVLDKEEAEELDDAIDEATLEAGEAMDVALGEAIVGLTLRGVKSSSRVLPPPLLEVSLTWLVTSAGLDEVVTSLIWSLVELSGGELIDDTPGLGKAVAEGAPIGPVFSKMEANQLASLYW